MRRLFSLPSLHLLSRTEAKVIKHCLHAIFSLLITLSFCFAAYASEDIQFGVKEVIESEVLGEHREFYVSVPDTYTGSEESFPVVYVLDGDVNRWKSIVGVLEALSTETLGNQVQQAIVVAIPNTHRSRDLTPTTLKEWKFEDRVLETFDQTGQADQFIQFLDTELLPYVEKRYRTNNTKVLLGESFGALFGAHVLLQNNKLFSDYLLIDPTSVWDNNHLNKAYHRHEFHRQTLSANVYFAFANNDHLGKLGITNRQWGQDFAAKIIAKSDKDFRAAQNYFEQESHGTVALMGWYHGFKFLLPLATEQ